MGPPRRGGSTPELVRWLLSRAISTIPAARRDACSQNGEKRRLWSGGVPRQSLPSSPFFYAGFDPASTSFSLVAAGFPHAYAFSLAAFFFCGVLETGFGAVEPLLLEEPAP
jgi:hypothetical protein